MSDQPNPVGRGIDLGARFIQKWIFIGAGLFFLVLTGFDFCWHSRIIKTGHVGHYKIFGVVSNRELLPGSIHLTMPFIQRIVEMDTQLRQLTVPAKSHSYNLQPIRTVVSFEYSIARGKTAACYRHIGEMEDVENNLLRSAVYESLKAATAGFSAERLIKERTAVKDRVVEGIETFINDTLKRKGATGIFLMANVAITEFKFSEDFEKVIEAKVQAAQKALEAVNDKVKVVTEASAKAEGICLESEAEVARINDTSMAKVEGIRKQGAALAGHELQMLRLRIIEKWNGEASMLVGGDNKQSGIPFLDEALAPLHLKVEDKATAKSSSGTPVTLGR
jgi:hypothetical protein